MGHYDSCRPGYCAGCGAAPGNLKNGKCPFCESRRKLIKNKTKEVGVVAVVDEATDMPVLPQDKVLDVLRDKPSAKRAKRTSKFTVNVYVLEDGYKMTVNGKTVEEAAGFDKDEAEDKAIEAMEAKVKSLSKLGSATGFVHVS